MTSVNNINTSVFKNIVESFFIEKVYRDEWNEFIDKNILIEDFILSFDNLSTSDKIRILCYNEFKNFKQLNNLIEVTSEKSVLNTLRRLNKSYDLEMKKIENLQSYKTTKKGLNLLKILVGNFLKNNEYLNKCLKNKDSDDIKEKSDMLDVKYIIKKSFDYLNNNKTNEIVKIISQGKKCLYLDIMDILNYDYEFCDLILDKPKELISIIEDVLNTRFSENYSEESYIKIRFFNLPERSIINIGNQRINDINKLILFKGVVRRKGDVNPRINNLQYLCTNPSCNFSEQKIKIPQIEEKLKTLKTCPKCKSGVELVHKELEDCMFLVLENDFSSDAESKKIHIKINKDLTMQEKYKRLSISSKIEVIGILKEQPIKTKSGVDSVNSTYILEANNIIFIEDEKDFNITKELEDRFISLKNNSNLLNEFVKDFASDISERDIIKKALILQHVGCREIKEQRTNSHILLIGDPSVAKTKLIRKSLSYAKRGFISSGTGSSKAGLGAAVVKDEFTGTFTLDPGVLPRGNNGMVAIDELDKLDPEDLSVLHTALEEQVITISKVIQAELNTKCSLVAGANPKYSSFIKDMSIKKQIKFPSSLLTRFDLIFAIEDKVNKENDNKIISSIVKRFSDEIDDNDLVKYDFEFISKYFQWVKSKFNPIMPLSIQKESKKIYVSLREASIFNESGQIVTRDIEGIIRFAFSHARFHQKEFVDLCDLNFAKDLLIYSVETLGMEDFRKKYEIEYNNN